MNRSPNAWAFAPTALFVLLWSSGALFAKWGLAHASAFAFLALRFALALTVLSLLAGRRGRWLPRPGTRWRVAQTGLLLVGSYSACYFLALDHGVTPGVLATLLGVQPILTLVMTEPGLAPRRLLGLVLALGGLALVVYDSLSAARFGGAGLLFALAALLSMTWGTLLQKGSDQAPLDVLPLQYAVGLGVCVALLPAQHLRVEWSTGLMVSVAWMGLVITGATLLLYRLIQSGNLVNVTSLFYLVPAGTALLDWLVLGNRLAPLALAGMAAIVLGLIQVFRGPMPRPG
ncbi:DMT family transporter [Caenimonas sedimenti]|uniref:DMT family transporter n=1 Tax=Caenimonas sedimenti TaxID=2596921 RepID=A0A562ZKC0_9BURK|nr:DMT family transporter [Caenimonas sedimenti]TWO69029.1 DMT family transporter [Caenimonas sedimenti]